MLTVQELANRLEQSVQWKTAAEMKDYFDNHDWPGDYSYHYDEQREFIQKVRDYFNKENN